MHDTLREPEFPSPDRPVTAVSELTDSLLGFAGFRLVAGP